MTPPTALVECHGRAHLDGQKWRGKFRIRHYLWPVNLFGITFSAIFSISTTEPEACYLIKENQEEELGAAYSVVTKADDIRPIENLRSGEHGRMDCPLCEEIHSSLSLSFCSKLKTGSKETTKNDSFYKTRIVTSLMYR